MSGCIFIIGKVDKKLIIPLIYILFYTVLNIINMDDYTNISADYIENFGNSIAEILVFFVSIVVKYAFKTKLAHNSEKQNYLKDFGILFLITAFHKINDILPNLLDKINKAKDDNEDDNSRELLLNGALVFIIITVTTFLTLKYKYYIHHIICIVIITIICVALDFLFLNFEHTNKSTIISSIFLILSDSILYSYLKYLIEFKYYFYLDILYIYGIFRFFANSVALGVTILVHKLDGTNHIFFQFYDYYDNNGLWTVISRFLIGLFITGFLSDILEFIILNKMSPNYIIIGFETGKIPLIIIKFVIKDYEKRKLKVLILVAILVLFVLQVIILLFYFEIFEFNFCSLNKNTKRNIEKRERMLSLNQIEVNNIDLENESEIMIKDYIVKNDTRKSIIEMASSEEKSSNSLN